MYATSSCLTKVDGNHVSLALKGPSLGIATAYGAQIRLERALNALFGTPLPHAVKVDLGVIDGEYVNIVVNGHEPMVAAIADALGVDEPALPVVATAPSTRSRRRPSTPWRRWLSACTCT
jgi:carbon-monoxide dehydrogenase catalytic subunit